MAYETISEEAFLRLGRPGVPEQTLTSDQAQISHFQRLPPVPILELSYASIEPSRLNDVIQEAKTAGYFVLLTRSGSEAKVHYPPPTLWLPIATAPQAHSNVILLWSAQGGTSVGCWSAVSKIWYQWPEGHLNAQPTHWQPLPPGPEEGAV